MPLVCTDSNLRSIKEYHKDGWKITQSNLSIDKMIDISNEQIYETENTKMFISHKERKKIYSRMKKDNTLLSMEYDKKKLDLKLNKHYDYVINLGGDVDHHGKNTFKSHFGGCKNLVEEV